MKKLLPYLLSACIFAGGLLLLYNSGVRASAPDSDIKLHASQQLEECFQSVKQLRYEKELPINRDDTLQSGLIGAEYTFITTTLGGLDAKRTTINPNWAAVVVDMFSELGLKRGDCIAVNCSGSFPALNLAVICAAECYGLQSIVISSFGASTHGANEPELTYPDMEYWLNEQGILHTKSRYFSIGGRKDIGGEMDPGLISAIVERLTGYGYKFLYEEDLIENIHMRHALYKNLGDIRCFVNVGGNDVSFGDSKIIVYADGGILTDLPDKDKSTGLVQLFLRDGVPVVHLLNIKSIASAYGLPIDPESPVTPGTGEVYSTTVYSKPAAAIILALGFLPLAFIKRNKKTGM